MGVVFLMLLIKYALFAVIATIINLLSQFLTFEFIDWFAFIVDVKRFSLMIGILVGTAAGLLCKYFLDKKYIFYHQTNDVKDDAKTFAMYTLVGVFTTIIFWGTEFLFDYLSTSPMAKYIGAILGLSIGYVCKYFLDKKYVFNQLSHEAS